nr:sensor histidine kinase [Bifidobacterium polysaccharolyticum]
MESQQKTIRRLSRAEGASIERERVANEMHDTIAQSLTSILALARVAHEELIDDIPAAQKHLEMIASTSKGSLDDTRRMIADSVPADLDGRDLKTALERTVHSTAAKTGFQSQCRIQRTLPPLPKQTEVNLLRIVQESLTNISKHANAQHVQVSLLLKRPELLELQIKDDGCGFDIQNLDFQEMEKAGHGYGLRNMAKRAQDAGGRCTVTSVPGQGTSITVNIPVERPSNTTQPDKEER